MRPTTNHLKEQGAADTRALYVKNLVPTRGLYPVYPLNATLVGMQIRNSSPHSLNNMTAMCLNYAKPSVLLQSLPLQAQDCFRAGRVAPASRCSRLRLLQGRAGKVNAASLDRVWPIPRNAEETAQKARAAVQRAWKDGVHRQRVELLLPLIGATDLDDWPGGVRQQFKAVLPMIESMLAGLKSVEGLQGALTGEIWDQGDGALPPACSHHVRADVPLPMTVAVPISWS